MEVISKKRDWIEVLAKLLPGIGAVIAGIFIPLAIHVNSEKNRSHQLYAQIVSEREKSDSDLRAKMFDNLINSFFDSDSAKKHDEEKITLLRLLALNFHEFFDFKPIFEELDKELSKSEKDELKDELKDVAQEIISKQEAMLCQLDKGKMYEREMYQGEENGVMIPPDSETAFSGHRLGIVVTNIDTKEQSAKLHVWDMEEYKTNKAKFVDIEFKVTCYDMPFIDNTKLFNHTRFAVTLDKIVTDTTDSKKPDIVLLKIFFFPETYMSSRDRPYLDEMLGKLNL